MKVLITGGAGFIGSHVTKNLLGAGYDVEIIDDFSTGRMENLDGMINKIKLVEGSILDRRLLQNQFDVVDVVIHLAAQISVTRSLKSPIIDAETNILGSLRVAEFCIEKNIKHIIFASSGGAIYGEPKILPATEETTPSPLSPYAASKLAFENYLNYYQEKGLTSSILRLSNIYGPKQDPRGEAGVISIFLENIKQSRPLSVFGDGSTSRDYLNVTDLADLITIFTEKRIPGCYNISTGKETTLNTLIDVIRNVTECDPVINTLPLRHGEVKNISLSNQKVNNVIGWKPRIELNEGVKTVWNWLKSL